MVIHVIQRKPYAYSMNWKIDELEDNKSNYVPVYPCFIEYFHVKLFGELIMRNSRVWQ